MSSRPDALTAKRFWLGFSHLNALLSRGEGDATTTLDVSRRLFPQNAADEETGKLLDPVSLQPLPGGPGEVFRVGNAGYSSATIEKLSEENATDPLTRARIEWSSVTERPPERLRSEPDEAWFCLSDEISFNYKTSRGLKNKKTYYGVICSSRSRAKTS